MASLSMASMSIAEIGAVYKALGRSEAQCEYEQHESTKLRATNDRLLELLLSTQQGQAGQQSQQQQFQPSQQQQAPQQHQQARATTSNVATTTALTEQVAADHVRILKLEKELSATMEQRDQFKQLAQLGAAQGHQPLPRSHQPTQSYGQSYGASPPGRPAVGLGHPGAATPGQPQHEDLLCDFEEAVPVSIPEAGNDRDGYPEAEWQTQQPRPSGQQQASTSATAATGAPAERPAFKRYFQDDEPVRASGSTPAADTTPSAPRPNPPPPPPPTSSAPPTAPANVTETRTAPFRRTSDVYPYPRHHFPRDRASFYGPPRRGLPPPPPGRAHPSYADVEAPADVPSFNSGAGTFVPGFSEAWYDEATVPRGRARERSRLSPVDSGKGKEDETDEGDGDDDGSSSGEEEGSAAGEGVRRKNRDSVAFTPAPDARDKTLRTAVLTNLPHAPTTAKDFLAAATSGANAETTGFVVAARVLATGPVSGSLSAVVEFLSAESAASFVSRFGDSKAAAAAGPAATLLTTPTHPLGAALLRAIVREGATRALSVPAEAVAKTQALHGVLATIGKGTEQGESAASGDTTVMFESVAAARAAREALIKNHAVKSSEAMFVGEEIEVAVQDVKDARAALENADVEGGRTVVPPPPAAVNAAATSAADDTDDRIIAKSSTDGDGKKANDEEKEPEDGEIKEIPESPHLISLPSSPTPPARPTTTAATTTSSPPTAMQSPSARPQQGTTTTHYRTPTVADDDASDSDEDSDVVSYASSPRRPLARDERDRQRLAAAQGLGRSRWALDY
ncbi:uncharacterized protein K452DRAFT_33313 [Aplosporella prunicola CBS 121167]|uniref:Uncharacterized protein n=1 Tax=Aplosporella prunicola CBS 121167 TaxID=1176127 RepID=A0A6A6BEP6_9PEZI|nr:uncharacterized protein K452DRAFT_33313 [Aplosporella prunicola CBS 121167]KAF2141744.1 hypothetical protein K452DRAFT_33313 [Aplosporella prunicola CBS 121167]